MRAVRRSVVRRMPCVEYLRRTMRLCGVSASVAGGDVESVGQRCGPSAWFVRAVSGRYLKGV